jgi:hypothetical protein
VKTKGISTICSIDPNPMHDIQVSVVPVHFWRVSRARTLFQPRTLTLLSQLFEIAEPQNVVTLPEHTCCGAYRLDTCTAGIECLSSERGRAGWSSGAQNCRSQTLFPLAISCYYLFMAAVGLSITSPFTAQCITWCCPRYVTRMYVLRRCTI